VDTVSDDITGHTGRTRLWVPLGLDFWVLAVLGFAYVMVGLDLDPYICWATVVSYISSSSGLDSHGLSAFRTIALDE
jgi:hypothetical protein